MSLDSLPADLILKIFHHLSFKDRVHLSGVNRLFRSVSMESIAKMKSLVINSDLTAYLTWGQKFSSLLESCSPILKSIDASDRSCNKWMFAALAQFVYPKLEHLKVMVRKEGFDTNKPSSMTNQVKMLVSHCPNLRSCILRLHCQFEWPADMVFEKMEKLEIQVPYDSPKINLSPTILPLIGKVPNLKHLTIGSDLLITESRFQLSLQEFTQLLASTPYLEKLHLELPRDTYVHISLAFMAAIPTWHLPNLTTLYFDVGLNCPNQTDILRYLPAVFPQLVAFKSDSIKEIDDQTILVLSQMKHLRELRLTRLCMTEDQIIDVLTSVPSIFTLNISNISEVDSLETFIDFLKSTGAIFRRDLEIQVVLIIDGSQAEFEDALAEIEVEDGPIVWFEPDEDYGNYVSVDLISYMPFDTMDTD